MGKILTGLSIIIPVHNEEGIIEKTICDLEKKLKIRHEIIVVNDRSIDKTEEIVKKIARQYENIRLISNKRIPGFTSVLKLGFENAAYNVVVPVMADFCDDILTIEKMAGKIEQGYDIVCASRYMKGGVKTGGPLLKSFFSRLVCLSMCWLIKCPTHDITNAFKMYRKEILKNINIESAGFAVSMQITLKAFFAGYRITELPTTWKGRVVGQSDFGFVKELKNYAGWYIWAVVRSLNR